MKKVSSNEIEIGDMVKITNRGYCYLTNTQGGLPKNNSSGIVIDKNNLLYFSKIKLYLIKIKNYEYIMEENGLELIKKKTSSITEIKERLFNLRK